MRDHDVEQFWNDFKELYRSLRRRLPSASDLSPTELRVLIAANRMAAPSTPGQLGAALQMTSPNIAAALRTMESAGMIERHADDNDRRRILVNVTQKGSELVEEIRSTSSAWLTAAIDDALSDDEQMLLLKSGELMRCLAESINGKL